MEGAEAVEFAPSYLDFPDNSDDRVVLGLRGYASDVGHFLW